MAANIRFYLDENVPIAVAEQLQRPGIDAITTRDLGLLGESDINHLKRAFAEGRVLCTHDADYLDMAFAGIEHTASFLASKQGMELAIGFVSWNWYMVFTHLKK